MKRLGVRLWLELEKSKEKFLETVIVDTIVRMVGKHYIYYSDGYSIKVFIDEHTELIVSKKISPKKMMNILEDIGLILTVYDHPKPLYILKNE